MIINPTTHLNGTLPIPGDKSISHRSVMLGALAKGTTHVSNFLMGADCLSTIACFRALGVDICVAPDSVTIHGVGLHGLSAPSDCLDVGNSGTTMRILSGILAGQPFKTELTGDASIQSRPMKRIMDPLTLMGANIQSKAGNDKAPLVIEPSALKGLTYSSPVASAQVKSALIMAGLYTGEPVTVIEPSLSRNHTELMLNHFGGQVTIKNSTITSEPIQELYASDVTVPGDISSAAFFLVAGLIVPNSTITLENVGINPTRDGILHVLKAMGGHIDILNPRTLNGESVADLVVKSSTLKATTIDGAIIPTLIDEIPVIAVACAFAEGESIIKDAGELKVKECDRIEAMVTELKKMGVDITATSDGMIIKGGQPIRGATLSTYHDHRIAMSLSIAALRASTPSIIEGDACISISYPGFFEDLKSLEN